MLRTIGLMFMLGAAALVGGCTPSGLLAHQFLRAPRSFPTVVAPEPRVYFAFPDQALGQFPLQLATLESRDVTLAYRVIPPADYQTHIVLTNHLAHGHARPFFRFKAKAPGTTNAFTTQPRGTVVLLHGYGLDQQSMFPWALLLAEAGWQCVIVDLRGHGESSGARIYFGIREADDLTALMNELSRRQQATWPVAAVGVSYGAAVALRWEAIQPQVTTAVAISPYDRLEVAVEGLRSDYAAWLPAGLIRRATEKLPGLVGVGPGGLDPVNWLQAHPVAALFIAGEADVVAPPASVRDLARRAGPPSRVVEVGGDAHEILPFRMDQLREPVEAWLEMEGRPNPPASPAPPVPSQ